ncbi:MAG: mechanosensitive ion channel [Lachnospiraceae bacterium]|nr:mechanosensitive ion channel [Lachnospiraceae bacterium]
MNKNNKKHGGLIVSIVLIVLALIFFNPGLFTKILPESITKPWNQLVWDLFVKDRESALTGGKIVACAMTVIYSVGLALLLKVILNAIHFKQQRAETVKIVLSKVLFFLIIVIGILIGVRCLGIDVTAILIGVGIIGIVIGFGAQSLVQDLITGLFMIAERDFQVGDIITIDDFRGKVKSIGLRSISMQDGGGNVRIINYSEIGQIVNLSAVESTAVVRIPVSYLDPLEKCEGAVLSAIGGLSEEHPEIFKKAPVYKGVDDLGEGAVTLLVTAEVDEADIFDARRIIQRAVRFECEKAGMQPPVEL